MYQMDQYTVSLLHFDDGIKDETGKVWTASGGAGVSTVQSKFGGSSLFLNGGQYLTSAIQSDFKFGTSDFSVDCWIYPTSVNSSYWNVIFDNRKIVSTGSGFCLFLYNGNLSIGIDNVTRATTAPVSLNTWQHVAITRANGLLHLFLDGKMVYSEILANSLTDGYAVIGKAVDNTFPFSGYIDELRISNVARWSENFNPPQNVNTPINLTATAGYSRVTLSWDAVTGATGYNVKRAIIAGGLYEIVASNISTNSYVDTDVVNGTTYYYVVTAVNPDGESANSNEASATPVSAPIPTGNALLRVTMIDSSEREYKLPMSDINGFINWLDSHSSGDSLSYRLSTAFDSKEYLLFDKIISFEVIT